MLVGADPSKAKVLVVVGSEGRPPGEVKRRVAEHFRGRKLPRQDRVRVVVVEPRHEARLCIGLGLPRGKCRKMPEELLSRARGRYEKHHLARWAHQIDPQRLLGERGFREYLEALKWLLEDP